MQTFHTVAQFLLVLTILVTLHELGHFLAARFFKIKVDKFYVFFDFMFPLPNVLNFALFKKKIGDTEYGLGWFPLGGYVAINGMVDETQDASKLASTPEPYEFRAKPAWQRLIVMLGGIIVNVLLAIVIYTGLVYVNGVDYVKKEELNKYGIHARDLGKKVGFMNGDKILKLNGQDFDKFDDVLNPDFLLGDSPRFTIERNGEQKEITLPKSFLNQLSSKENRGNFIGLPVAFSVLDVETTFPGFKAGIKKGDKIIQVDSVKINFYHDFNDYVKAHAGKTVHLFIERDGQKVDFDCPVTAEGRTGIIADVKQITNVETEKFAFFPAMAMGAQKAWNVVSMNIKGFSKIFKREVDASKALSGPVGMARTFFGSGIWDWTHILEVTALLSMGLAFMNILPIPALDGGHALVLLWEMISGREPSLRAQEIMQQIGTYIILALTAYVFYVDLVVNR